VTLVLLLYAADPLGLHATVAAASRTTPMPSATVIMHLAYSYDAAGRRTGLTLPDGQTQHFGYDAAGRVSNLTQAGGTPNTYTVTHNGAT
jgi:hypothetical protein